MFLVLDRYRKSIASFLLVVFTQTVVPTQLFALTSGPSQPEMQQFAPAGMDDLVDPFTGDFSYNIPLMDVGGYPINLNYASGITPDAEASWVGLGWNLNVGAINRSVRGLPDDFAGDNIETDYNVKPNETYGVSGGLGLDALGFDLGKNLDVNLNANFFYNNYTGYGISAGLGASVSVLTGNKTDYTGSLGISTGISSEDGLDITPTAGIGPREKDLANSQYLTSNIGLPFNTRQGLKGMTLSLGVQNTTEGGKRFENFGSNAFIGFAYPTQTPSIQYNHNNYSFSTSIKFKFDTQPVETSPFSIQGYYSGSYLQNTHFANPAYGYMYSGVSDSDNKLFDINREKDGGFNRKYTQNLPVTNYTYDIFQVSGQGVSGTYRLYRGDIGTVNDPRQRDVAVTTNVDLSFGLGVSFDTYPKIGLNMTNGSSGKWSYGSFLPKFQNENTPLDNINSSKEVVFFKKVGEQTIENDPYFYANRQKQTDLVQYKVISKEYVSAFYSSLATENNKIFNKLIVPNESQLRNFRNQRPAKKTSFITLTAKEAKNSNVTPIYNFKINEFNWRDRNDKENSLSNTSVGYEKTIIPRVDDVKKGHHISEVRVTDESGVRYVYGIPAYNYQQKEITFSVNANEQPSAKNTGLVRYTPQERGATTNRSGLENYYNCTTTPANAHSYLLTYILSSDYVDSDGIPGPSDGDMGTYTKFNYVKLDSVFKWRTPMSNLLRVASFSDGMESKDEDDKANIVYGEKEIWYLHSIETPTHVAEFYLSDRYDGLGAQGIDGGVSRNVRLQKLDKIVLYSKADKRNSSAIPIKTVYFEYSYKLCPNTINSLDLNGNNQGKLTLEKIWFTYGKSNKGVLNPYRFYYADQNFDGIVDVGLNPEYSSLNYDRWGNFKLNNVNMSNAIRPYTDQNKLLTDKYSAVYALSSIVLPTGGSIHVSYESDDYAYVQDKRACRMYSIDESQTDLYQTSNGNYNLIINLEEGFKPPLGSNHKDEFRKAYLEEIDLMFFRAKLNVVNSIKNYQEYVNGYAEIVKGNCEPFDPDSDGNYRKAKIVLKATKLKGISVNPITRAGWMYAKLNLSRELKGLSNASDGSLESMMGAIFSFSTEIVSMVTNFPIEMEAKQNSKEIVQKSKSFVRLNDPNRKKLGGGHRVKAILMSDNWSLMKSKKEMINNTVLKQNSLYGQTYSYTKNVSGRKISSGVAAYEPILGGEENPFRRPVYTTEKVPLAVDNEYFLEEPFGESFFPAPVVGYSKVTVKPIKVIASTVKDINIDALTGNGTGWVEQEFYTAKDYPVYTQRTGVETAVTKPSLIAKFLKVFSNDLVDATQGYYIELNDMHGKPKSKRVFPERAVGDNDKAPILPISEVEYIYKNQRNRLDNNVTTIDNKLSVKTDGNVLGVDVDLVHDQRQFESQVGGGNVKIIFKVITLPIVLIPIVGPFYTPTDEYIRLRTLVSTKVVNKYGILEQTIAKDNGASIATKNLAWDNKTGEVILTSVQNEFHDPIYSFNYPAHWAYSRLDLASSTEGMYFKQNYFNNNKSKFKDGDELLLDNSIHAYVNYLTSGDPNSAIIIDKAGVEVTSFSNAKVIRSGARNQANVPIGTVVSLVNPIQGDSIVFEKVINAGATEFKETWKRMGCDCDDEQPTTINPYLLGLKGNVRPYKSWTYLTDRYQRLVNNQMDIRYDGFYKDFSAFWKVATGASYLSTDATPESKWQYVMEITKYNTLGLEIENKDALGRFSMAQYGYARKLPVATSNNSQYKESGFDGFEDYNNSDCLGGGNHFNFKENFSQFVTNEQSHTGRKSIKVSPNGQVIMQKVIQPCE